MQINARLLLASKNKYTGQILYTFVLTYPRSILAEVNTHRMLSRNTSSSRAIPAKTFRKRILNEPFIPVYIGMNKKGMQAGDELSGWRRFTAELIIKAARYPMVLTNYLLEKLNVHKQVINRYLEPWMWCEQLVTATDLNNVMLLRNHKDAEPHFHELASQMDWWIQVAKRNFSVMESQNNVFNSGLVAGGGLHRVSFQIIGEDEWHCPFLDGDYFPAQGIEVAKKVSTARCARVSYFLPDGGKSDSKKDLDLVSKLSTSGHWSPFEHVATPIKEDVYVGNFRSFKQYRKEFSNERGGD